jgi:hypothetical protein
MATSTERILMNLAETRNHFFRYRRSNAIEAHFLENESLMLGMLDRHNLTTSLLRIINTPLPGFAEPVVVAPTPDQLNIGLQTNTNDTIVNGPCAICQDMLVNDGPTVTLRNCGHVFHQNCANAWYTRSVFCPLCRNDIRTANANQ